MEKYLNRVEVPATKEQDCNADRTKWVNGKCVAFSYGNGTECYFLHKTEERVIDDESKQFLTACVVDVPNPATTERVLARAKEIISNQIAEYDKSAKVNQFTLQGVPMWLDKATRAGLMLRLEAERTARKTDTTLWFGSQSFTIPTDKAIEMLQALEMYASVCYDNTQKHIAAVAALSNVEDVLLYDFTTDYPDPLIL